MLYLIGPAVIDTFPFSADAVKRKTGASWAAKDLLGRLRDREWMGEDDEHIDLSGILLPYNPRMGDGALLMLDVLHGIRLAGLPVFVMRGDFMPLGWFVLEEIEEHHEHLAPSGIGNKISHTIKITKVQNIGFDAGYSALGTIVDLFAGNVIGGMNSIVSGVAGAVGLTPGTTTTGLGSDINFSG